MRTIRVEVPIDEPDFGYVVVQAGSIRELEDKIAELMSEAKQIDNQRSVWLQPCGSLVVDGVNSRYYQPMVHRTFYENDDPSDL